jgi:periplasmic copper chaperone A
VLSRTTGLVAPLGLLACLAFAPAAIADGVADQIDVTDAYIRAVPPVVKTSAAFMELTNRGEHEFFLVDVDTPLAAEVELHMHIDDDGIMRMRRIPHMHLPPDQTVRLQPGGLHIMLFDLQEATEVGATVPLTLVFGDGSRKEVEAEVRSVQMGM